MIARRAFIASSLGIAATALPFGARAQRRVLIIGVLSPQSQLAAARNIESLRVGLREHGYTEGRDVALEIRYGNGIPETFKALAAGLIALNPAIIVVGNVTAILETARLTKSIPLIMTAGFDPVAQGLVESFARPGGNITGFAALASGLVPKRLELLSEVVPALKRVGYMLSPNDAAEREFLAALPEPAQTLGLDVRLIETRTPAEIEPALIAARRDGLDALLVSQSPLFTARRTEIVALVARVGIPTIYAYREYPEAGGLMSYGYDLPATYRRAAVYIDKILKGTPPGELPIEISMRPELVVNFTTARTLGLTLPPSILARVDAVIE